MSRTIQFGDEAAPYQDRSVQGHCSENAKPARLVACLLLVPEDSEPILTLLQKLAPHAAEPHNGIATGTRESEVSADADIWLDHSEAAAYLGVSTSTLYHYSSHNRIERRKLGGRLEYRRSALDEFKRAHTLPASCHPASARIISSAHSSGK
jgi:excisionase family DNA binding protein